MPRALFLDRDGIINVERHYVHKADDFTFVDGIFDLCRTAQREGFLPIVVTNQAGIARGYYTEDDFQRVTAWMIEAFAAEQVTIAQVYFCPFHPDGTVPRYRGDSFDRKPNPGMLLRARDDWQLDLAQSVLVGDRLTDIEAGRRAGIGRLCLVPFDSTLHDTPAPDDVLVCRSLREAASQLFPAGETNREPLPDADAPARVHVVIVNWNSGELLLRCLDALARQTCRDFRVTVVDNGSATFDEAGILERYDFVRCLPLSRNEGFARANNAAIARHGTLEPLAEWTWLLNPDAFPEPDCLRHLLDAAERRPDAASFATRLLHANDPNRLDGAGDVYHVSGLVWRRGHGRPAASRYLDADEVFSPCAAAALYRTSALREAGGFDEDFGSYIEDIDLGFRLRLAGHQCQYVPEAVVAHVGSATTGRRSDAAVYYGQRNMVWCFVKNVPGALFWCLLPLHLVLNVVSVMGLTLTGRGVVALRAKRDALLGLAGMWRKRRTVRAGRRVSLGAIWRAMTKRPPLDRSYTIPR